MLLTRQAVRFTEGWNLAAVRAAGSAAAKRLVDHVQPYAWRLIDDHRRADRLLVMATTSPYDLASPLSAALGFDHVLATRYGVREDTHTGRVDGGFVWGTGKCRAVREWAAANDVDLRESFAYSDSFYDLPLLRAVGHPVAVNPDPRLEVVARCLGWRVRNLDVSGRRAQARRCRTAPRVECGRPSRIDVLRPVRHRCHRAHSAPWSSDRRGESSQLLRSTCDRGRARAPRPCRALHGEAGDIRHTGRRCDCTRDGRDSGRPRFGRRCAARRRGTHVGRRRDRRHPPAGHHPARRGVLRRGASRPARRRRARRG